MDFKSFIIFEILCGFETNLGDNHGPSEENCSRSNGSIK